MKIVTMRTTCGAAATAACAAILSAVLPVRADVTISNRVVSTPRHVFTIDDTGLPAQIDIRARTNDIPLAWRAEKECPAAIIRRIGRGPQFAGPMRLEAVIDKVTVVAKADAPAELAKTDKGLEAAGTWQADKLKGRVHIVYAEDGALSAQVTYDPKGTDLERLDLVVELDGLVDTAIAGDPVKLVEKGPVPLMYGTLGSKPGVLWLNGKNPEGDGRLHKGLVSPFFLGSGDRGFTWLAGNPDGFVFDKDEPSMSVELTREKKVLWKIALANTSPRGGERTVEFALLTHPAKLQAADRRLRQWQPWAERAGAPALTIAGRGACKDDLVRADAGSVCEAAATRALLEGVAGGEALTAGATLADRFSLGLFRYLAAPHTALAAQLRPNAAMLTSAGASPAPDRVALGRALLHDIGVDVNGLARRMEAANVLRALDAFGYFESDGQTEFLPYWRAEGIFQLGEKFEADVGFAVTSESPTARTRVSAFIRPTAPEMVRNQPVIRRKTLFVLVNEGTNAVREYLYIWNPNYVFGGPNRLQAEHIYSQLDFSGIAADGDWERLRVERTLPELIKSRAGRGTGWKDEGHGLTIRPHMSELMDVESGGMVRVAEREVQFAKKYYGDDFVKGGFQLYGPIYVPPRGMRLLFGEGVVDLPHGVVGRVVDKSTGKPLSVPVHLFRTGPRDGIKESETLESLKKGKIPFTTVHSGNDGWFRAPGFGGGTILAELNGKLFSTRPQAHITADSVRSVDQPAVDEDGNRYWPRTGINQLFENPTTGAAGKWTEVLIEVDSSRAQQGGK